MSGKRLLHYSKKPLGKLRSLTKKDQRKFEGGVYKPSGLWISVEGENDWRAWCEAENFGIDRLACVTEIVLREDANIVRLKNAFDIDRFHEQYRFSEDESWRREYIQWADVAASFDGIIIAPYCWGRRFEGRASGWYYGWDCASGCIWNVRAIAEARQLP